MTCFLNQMLTDFSHFFYQVKLIFQFCGAELFLIRVDCTFYKQAQS
jgi:hypothetical protein